MRNTELDTLDRLVGEWTVTLSDAWFLEPPGTEIHGTATISWLGESFLVWRTELASDQHAHSTTTWVMGRSDANDTFVVLYHDDRGVCREFTGRLDGDHLEMLREDPDFHQRFVVDIEADVIRVRPDASEDQGATWRKDFDLTYVRS
ncbi:hypothetical protein BLA60_10335 [Actinophytocola xinjiangensis]|uniref:DUF1579 domain-containing protein n=1 Tax=Actinophytocola xinjiangensis TaxID=485602 RepID=A0A7Z1AZV7_9PSEU|nr:hypothetical protein BLA60_10335 [Actinophytocola xinjiangensis]